MSERPAPASITQDGVVLLHGISRTARSFRKMQRTIEANGFSALNLDYASRRKPLGALAEDIHPAIERFTGSIEGSVHFVCHSMGGLLARVYLAQYRPQRLGRVVMLGTPNGGSEIADRLRNFLAYRAFFGPAGQQLGTLRDAATNALLPPVDYPVGVIAGNRSIYPVAAALLPRPPRHHQEAPRSPILRPARPALPKAARRAPPLPQASQPTIRSRSAHCWRASRTAGSVLC